MGSKPMLYPSNIKWAPITTMDKVIAGVVVVIWLIGLISSFVIPPKVKTNEKDTLNKPTTPPVENKPTTPPVENEPTTPPVQSTFTTPPVQSTSTTPPGV